MWPSCLRRFELWLVVRCSPRFRRRVRVRRELAAQYLSGAGIEIGALHMPLPLPASAQVRYLDRAPVAEQRRWFPELSLLPVVPVDLLDDAEMLRAVNDESQDFLIANHVIEHMQDPISTLWHWLRVLRSGGIVYFAVPDKRFTFDKARPLTSLGHLLCDFSAGPAGSFDEHVTEIARLVERVPEEDIPQRVKAAHDAKESPHFHVWTAESFREVLEHCHAVLCFPFSIEEIRSVDNEFIVVLRKGMLSQPGASATSRSVATQVIGPELPR